ncbi:hypothetical protein T310_3394 [Rasamsonia emersonii CBS 393.64]|uniref:Uncharacterized protein n=1 Tax=Rasamsonia emersonii (strain ATCC 16479 / CBS 393.64 / IMI 116815) TaxID=1408163 RepID=A0A0F4YY90_RASE3|nr:hypothetical protein T310_3394 [Rasamsonia emersonii CBS 393.64]KKA22603.1 hypothetical protein T310_3394 [Rasamsonia emersonii CBS 393.64]
MKTKTINPSAHPASIQILRPVFSSLTENNTTSVTTAASATATIEFDSSRSAQPFLEPDVLARMRNRNRQNRQSQGSTTTSTTTEAQGEAEAEAEDEETALRRREREAEYGIQCSAYVNENHS